MRSGAAKGLLVIVGFASAWSIVCGGSQPPPVLVAVAESWQQVRCTPVPIQIISSDDGEVRLGPTDRYTGLAVAPSGDRIAATRLDYDLCDGNVDDEPETSTLLMIDVATLEVTELRTSPEPIPHLHWSPDERQLALFGIWSVAIFDIEQRRDLATAPRGDAQGDFREGVAWFEGGRTRLVYADASSVVGLSDGPATEPARWEPPCSLPQKGVRRLRQGPQSEDMVIEYGCGDRTAGSGDWEVTLGHDGTLSPRRPSPGTELWFTERTSWHAEVEDRFPGAVADRHYGTDSTGRLRVLALLYLESGAELRVGMPDEISPMDVKTQIVLDLLDDGVQYVPVDLTYTDDYFSFGGKYAPLHDVAILD